MLNNDRRIQISAAGSRRAASWPVQELWLSELYDRLRTPVCGTETMEEYLALPKSRQDELKDVGGFVGGRLRGGARKAGAVESRDLITLDMDHIPPGGTAGLLRRLAGMGCGYAVYSTRKHTPAAPRLRVVVPTDRPMSADEYEPVARRLASLIEPGLSMFDRTTFETVRLMYWPSRCAGSEYVCEYADLPLLSADGMLAGYENWQDVASWPRAAGEDRTLPKGGARQEDPAAKSGVIGAFCRAYDIPAAMDKFLPDVYLPAAQPGRYTYAGGSTTGGAVLYEDGRFLYSHHATDPAGGRLVNAFDLVRLHRFGDQDDTAAPGTPVNRLPSFAAMRRLACEDEGVLALLDADRYAKAMEVFDAASALPVPVGEDPAHGPSPALAGAADPSALPAPDTAWMRGLIRSPNTGKIESTVDNFLLILNRDPRLAGRVVLDEFAGRGMALGPYPWDGRTDPRVWADSDDSGVRWYMEKVYGATGKEKILDALALCGRAHARDPVRDYLTGLQWDGTPRLETLFVDYLGAADTLYTRQVTRKAFCAAVARVLRPGIKFDNMTILSGPQGIGKSTLLRRMGRGWFSDSLKTFEGKEACELIQGSWIIEVGELEAMSRSDVGRIKQFLSQSEDIFRAPYGRRTELHPRRCVFFGTSNHSEYLRDPTGGRRMWPVDVGLHSHSKTVWDDLTEGEVGQLWAEAAALWQQGEPLFLSGEVEEDARRQQEDHRERSPREGVILAFLERPVPQGWSRWDLTRRRTFWSGGITGEHELVPRDRVCALEVWCEALNGDPKYMKYRDAQEINAVIAAAPGWERSAKAVRFGWCGVQKGFIRGRQGVRGSL